MPDFFAPANRKRLSQLLILAIAASAATYARTTLGPLQESIKHSLHLSDNQIGLIQGMGMALPIAIASIPLGLLADRTSRSRMLFVFLALMLASCVLIAFASGFASLLMARALSGLASAGVFVAAYSMAGDLFAPTMRGRATMVMTIGEVSGAPAAFAAGGAILVYISSSMHWDIEDWRLSLLCMSALLVPAVLSTALLRDPVRTKSQSENVRYPVWPELWRYRRLAVPLQLARAALFIADGAVFVWAAPFFARVHHLQPDQIGTIIGTILLAGGLLGPVLGGPMVDMCQRRGGPRRVMTILVLVAMLSVPASLFAITTSVSISALMLAIFLVLGFTNASAAIALTLIVLPRELRGLNLGISMVVGSLFFGAVAPSAVSVVSSFLGGDAMIGKALAVVCAGMSLLNATILLVGRQYFPSDTGTGSAISIGHDEDTSDGCMSEQVREGYRRDREQLLSERG